MVRRRATKKNRGKAASQNATLSAPTPAPAPARPVDPRISKLMKFAAELGFVCRPLAKYQMELSKSISSKMKNRIGTFVYQAHAYSLPGITKETAMQLFPASFRLGEEGGHTFTWRASTTLELRTMLGSTLELGNPSCTGISRALRTASERAVRVVATLLPPFEVTWIGSVEKLYLNLEFCLFDEDGEMHLPKDTQRVEKLLTTEQQQEMRVAVLQDLQGFSQRANLPLAPGFWRQLGRPEKAAEMEALLAQPQQPARQRSARPPRPARVDRQEYTISCILDEMPANRVHTRRFLVRWNGYDPTWEQWRIHGLVGSPIETWEPLLFVRNTEALQAWEEAQE